MDGKTPEDETLLDKVRRTLSALSPEERRAYLSDPASGYGKLSIEDRREIMSLLFEKYVDEYHAAVADPVAVGAWSLLRMSLENLRLRIEDPADEAISWRSPVVELRFPLPWDWEERAPLPDLFEDEDFETFDRAAEKGARSLLFIRYTASLKALTKGAALEQRDGKVTELIAPEVQKAIDEMSEEERAEFLAGWGLPFTLGDPRKVLEPGEEWPVREDAADAVKGLAPALPFHGNVDGKPFSGSIVVSFHPLLINADSREAFWPVLAALVFDPDPETGEAPTPETWAEEDRETFWTSLLKPFTEQIEALEKDVPAALKSHDLSTISEKRVFQREAAAEATKEVRALAPPPSRARFLLDSETRLPKATASFLAGAGALRLPRKKWSAIPKWEDLVEREAARLQAEHGEDAFRDSENGPALLVRRYAAGTEAEVVQLTSEARRDLEVAEGGKGFRRVEKDADGIRREYLVRRFRAGAGHITAKLSWYGKAWPLTEDGLDAARLELEKAREQGGLFEELSSAAQNTADNLLENLGHIRDGKPVMEFILREFGAEGRNPLTVPAWKLRSLLECENDPNGMARLTGCLEALRRVDFALEVAGRGKPLRVSGSFLSEWTYAGKGAGDHADGDFSLTISENFIGCLRVFNVKGQRLPDGRDSLFSWEKRLSSEERKVFSEEPFIRGFSRLLPHFDRAKSLTDSQSRLLRFVEEQLTRNDDPVPKSRRAYKAKKGAANEKDYRVYGREFCPLLPIDGLRGALGHFLHNPEDGRKLGGTARSGTKTGGGHTDGLLAVMGHEYPPGAAREKRQKAVRAALGDLSVVVQEALHGVAAARLPDGLWLTLEQAAGLPEKVLVEDVKFFLFVSKNTEQLIGAAVEDHHAERLARGEVDFPLKVTTDRAAADRSERERRGERFAGDSEMALHLRLVTTRKARGLTLSAVGKLFGVSHPVVFAWENRRKPIPEELVPLVVKWIDHEVPPTAEELAARRTRRTGKKASSSS